MARIPRRRFLQLASAQLGAAALAGRPASAAGQAAARTVVPPDVIVVGAGAFGGWTALVLREMGLAVTLVDAYGPGSPRATSGGETRQIRAGYGDREIYTRWALRALERWKAREQEFGRPLLVETGRLLLAPAWTDGMEATRIVLARHGVPHEVVRHDELARRYPQMNPEGIEVALFEPAAGVLRAREGCLAVAAAFEGKGGTLRLAHATPGRRAGGRLLEVDLAGGGTLPAQTFVFACGPWLGTVFPDVMGPRLQVPRRDVFFFGTPPGDDRFTWPNLPNYSEAAYYGFPSIDHRGFKVCPVGEPTLFDPDVDERLVSPLQLRRARAYLARRFPALRDQPLVEGRVCQLENTADEHFIIDRHPELSNVWIAGGGSGHGYKHGPVVGEYIAARVAGRDSESALDELFRLKPGVSPADAATISRLESSIG